MEQDYAVEVTRPVGLSGIKESLTDSAIGVAVVTTLVTQATILGFKSLVDAAYNVADDGQGGEEEMYAKIGHAIVNYGDSLERHGVSPEVLQHSDSSVSSRRFNISPSPDRHPPNSPRMTPSEMGEQIATAIAILEDAKNSTTCRHCKQHLDTAIDGVRSETESIVKASEKQKIMNTLKDRGELPETSTWEDLSSSDRKRVNRIARKSIKVGKTTKTTKR